MIGMASGLERQDRCIDPHRRLVRARLPSEEP
jgi:hypothetical protein